MTAHYNYTKVLRITGGLFLFLLFACNSAEETNASKEAPRDTTEIIIEKGKVSVVPIRDHPGESFAMYIPRAYDEQKTYPVIFFFDPSGKGSRPLEKYQTLAERYNIILAGSNDAKNGLAMETILAFAQHMIKQVKSDVAINSRAVFTGGFSGGARVAANVAMRDQSVKGVIGCSAGFQPQNDSLPFVFAGITADEDMNYLEMQKLELLLDMNKGDHLLISGRGIHEWPDTTKMNYAMRFLLFRSLKTDIAQKTISEFLAQHSWKSGNKVNDYSNAQFVYRHLEGITDVSIPRGTIMQLENDPAVKQAKAQHLANLQMEEKLQEKYSKALLSESAEWWTEAAKKLEEGKAGTKDILMSRRILNFLSLQCYMMSEQALIKADADAAVHFLTVYSKVDPGNPEWAYKYAILYAAAGVPGKIWQSLKQASDRGFSDVERLESEAAFMPYKNDDRFKQLVDRIRRNR